MLLNGFPDSRSRAAADTGHQPLRVEISAVTLTPHSKCEPSDASILE